MLDCARIKGPCSVKPAPPPPPCPPPPKPPFKWIYVWCLLSVFGVIGLIYKFYLWRERKAKDTAVKIWRPRRLQKRPYHYKDLPPCVQYLIIGGGAAGWAAYTAIQEHDKNAKVFFITKEDCLPYMLPPMGKHVWWNPEPPDIKTLNYVADLKRHSMYYTNSKNYMDTVPFYRKKKGPALSVATGWCVTRVDADEHAAYVMTRDGEFPIYYERCLLAPGAKANKLSFFKCAPKGVRDKVCSLRTIRDLEIAYRKVKDAKHVVVIGGGCLGSELAWYLGNMNKVFAENDDRKPFELVHIIKDNGILGGFIPEYLGEWAAEVTKVEGATLLRRTHVYDAFESPDGRLELTLSDGTSIVTDYAFVAVGAKPRIELAEPSFLELDSVNGGYLVNSELQARTHLYIAGDAASIYSQLKDTRLRMEHFGNAQEQGEIAGANMTGYWKACNMEPHFHLQFGEVLDVEAVGEVGACMPTVAVFKRCNENAAPQSTPNESGDRPCYKKADEYKDRYKRGLVFYIREETVVGMVFWNMPPIDDRVGVATEILRTRPSYKEISLIADALGFPETQCVYKKAEELREEAKICFANIREF